MKRRDFLKKVTKGSTAAGLASSSGLLGQLLMSQSAHAANTGYKALVCINLSGGCDGMSMFVPSSSSDYKKYQQIRQSLAVEQSRLLPLKPISHQRYDMGFHPDLPGIQHLFAQGKLAVMGNVGTLLRPVEKYSMNRATDIPPHLFSHNSQRKHWMRGHFATTDATGWAGRFADHTGDAGDFLPMNYMIGNAVTQWQVGKNQNPLALPVQKVKAFKWFGRNDALYKDVFERMNRLSVKQGNVLERAYGQTLMDMQERLQVLAGVLDSAPATHVTQPNNNSVAEKLNQVANLISQQGDLTQNRQIFMVTMGGWDTHKEQNEKLASLLPQLDAALQFFNARLEELGLSDSVTTFTMSDFNRTLSSNGDGTDHGWGGYQMVMGGAVRGGDIYGEALPMELGGEDDFSKAGRMIPKISTDQVGATLLQWMGLDPADVTHIFPNLTHFDTHDLGFMMS